MTRWILGAIVFTFAFQALASGTYIVPPPKPKVDCSKAENKSNSQCKK